MERRVTERFEVVNSHHLNDYPKEHRKTYFTKTLQNLFRG